MSLVSKTTSFYLPSYSLTSDVLGFIRCGLQYRYQGVGKIPSTKPFQLWFGEFIHGVMEEAYVIYQSSVQAGSVNLPPWNPIEIYLIGKRIEKILRDRKITPNNQDIRRIAYLRAVKAINELGPHLFPLISEAEIPLSSTREMLNIPRRYQTRNIPNYEITGRVDVITSVQLNDPKHKNNTLVHFLLGFLNQERAQGRLKNIPNDFEVIIDYKGARRPPVIGSNPRATDYWNIYGWQVKTYTHIREKQPRNLPVVLGIIIYLNELLPTWDDINSFKKDIASNSTDITPSPGSNDWKIIHMKKPHKGHMNYNMNRQLSWDFRMRRALRLESMQKIAVDEAVNQFDRYVRQIEISHAKERLSGVIINSWPKNASDPDTCTACDNRSFCNKHPATGPSLPS